MTEPPRAATRPAVRADEKGGAPRRRLTAALTALVLLAAACGEGGEASDDEAAAPDDGGGGTAAECPEGAPLPDDADRRGAVAAASDAVELDAGDQFFDPTCVTDVSEGTVTLAVTNTGESLHNIKIEEQGIDVDVEPGETVSVDVDVGSEPVAFTCKYHSTLGMHGAIAPSDGP